MVDLLKMRKGLDLPEDAKGLAGICLHVVPDCVKWKSKSLQMSNWENCPLTERQRTYAAMDAWAGLATAEAIRGTGAAASPSETDAFGQETSQQQTFITETKAAADTKAQNVTLSSN